MSSTPPPSSLPPGIRLPDPPTPKERRAERAILVLYLCFFLFWSAGLCLGLFAPGGLLFGLPVWFSVGGVISYIAACLALAWTVRRYFQ